MLSRHAFRVRRTAFYQLRQPFIRLESTSTSPPLLLKLRSDLKTAMRAKETQKLNAIRAILTDVTDASKSQNPATTDMHILSFLQKRIAQGKASAEAFANDGRADLKEKEDSQVAVLETYAADVKTLGEDEIRQHVGAALTELSQAGAKLNKGIFMKKLLGPGGALEGQPVDKQLVAKAVDTALANSS